MTGYSNNKDKFYQTEWFIWLMLICFAPVGIALLFSNERLNYNEKVKINISILFASFFITYVLVEKMF